MQHKYRSTSVEKTETVFSVSLTNPKGCNELPAYNISDILDYFLYSDEYEGEPESSKALRKRLLALRRIKNLPNNSPRRLKSKADELSELLIRFYKQNEQYLKTLSMRDKNECEKLKKDIHDCIEECIENDRIYMHPILGGLIVAGCSLGGGIGGAVIGGITPTVLILICIAIVLLCLIFPEAVGLSASGELIEAVLLLAYELIVLLYYTALIAGPAAAGITFLVISGITATIGAIRGMIEGGFYGYQLGFELPENNLAAYREAELIDPDSSEIHPDFKPEVQKILNDSAPTSVAPESSFFTHVGESLLNGYLSLQAFVCST